MGTLPEKAETLFHKVLAIVQSSSDEDEEVQLEFEVVLDFLRCPKYKKGDSAVDSTAVSKDDSAVDSKKSALAIDLFRLIFFYILRCNCNRLSKTMVRAVRAYVDPEADLITAREKFNEALRELPQNQISEFSEFWSTAP